MPTASRHTDPETSHAAGRQITKSGKRDRQTNLVARLVRALPGRTSAEYGDLASSDKQRVRHVVARRLPEAERIGLVKRGLPRHCHVTKRRALTWYPTGNK